MVSNPHASENSVRFVSAPCYFALPGKAGDKDHATPTLSGRVSRWLPPVVFLSRGEQGSAPAITQRPSHRPREVRILARETDLESSSQSPAIPTRAPASRRRFMAGVGTLVGAAITQLAAPPEGEAATESSLAEAPVKGVKLANLPAAQPNEAVLLRMQRELQRALQKPFEQRHWAMVIDLRKCVGCSACTIACKAENRLPPGVVYRPVIEEEIGEYPNVTRRFLPRPCMQCENPPCVPVCPVGATYQRIDGIVEINYEQCIGCRYCMTACPYNARVFDSGDYYTTDTPQLEPYETLPTYEYGKVYDRPNGGSPVGNVRKCHFCLHRLDSGMLPECVTTCIGVATYFGDLNDPESLVSELVASPNVHRLKEELGTKPRVYYLL